MLASAQVAVDENGAALDSTVAAEEIPLLGPAELEELVASIALYPDDLLAIVLPASTYPLQLVQAERFLRDLKLDPDLEPEESWDDSIVALINYPEAIQLLTKDLDRTWRLGEAVVAQQADVIAAIEAFRDRAYTAGNLKTDTRQTVVENDGVIEIEPAMDDVIYVPYYEPAEVVVYQPRPVYHYYPRAYPIYYYPYPYGYSFSNGFFWGVTTAFTVGWFTNSLHVYHHSYYGHPYYGRYYGYDYWYRRPSVHIHNNYYYNRNAYYGHGNRYGHGDYWRPRPGSTVGHYDQRVTRSRHYPGSGSGRHVDNGPEERRYRSTQRLANNAQDTKRGQRPATASNQVRTAPRGLRAGNKQQAPVRFRERPDAAGQRGAQTAQRSATGAARTESSAIQFRQREVTPSAASRQNRQADSRLRPAGNNAEDRTAIRFRDRNNSGNATARRSTSANQRATAQGTSSSTARGNRSAGQQRSAEPVRIGRNESRNQNRQPAASSRSSDPSRASRTNRSAQPSRSSSASPKQRSSTGSKTSRQAQNRSAASRASSSRSSNMSRTAGRRH